MKMDKPPSCAWIASLLFLFCVSSLSAAVYPPYYGNGKTDAGGAVGQGSLSFTDNGSVVHGTFNLGGASPTYFNNYLVLYFDSRSGGFSDTSRFIDNSTVGTRTASGYNTSGARATAIFAPNFSADYALVLSRNLSKGLLYELAGGQAFNDPVMINWTDSGSTWKFDFNLADINATGNYFRFESTATSSSGTGYRYLESFETLTGAAGFNTVRFDYYDSYGVEPVPESTNAGLAVFGCLLAVGGVVSRFRRPV